MPKHQIEYSVLLSSPSDLPEERKAAEEIVAEVATSWGRASGASIRLLSWENDVAPSFGSEPQAVINDALGENWDVYLGLMHIRFGSPTQKFGSGTEEEFERAYHLWEKNQKSRELMFYFKSGKVDPGQIDVDQLIKVRAFKSKISKLGGLYKEFSDVEMFRNLLRAHLTTVLSELHRNHLNQDASLALPAKHELAPLETGKDEPGILDLFEAGTSGMEAMAKSINTIGMIMTESTENLGLRQKELERATALGDIAGVRKSINDMSSDMLTMAKNLADTRRDYSTASRTAMDGYSRAISFAKTTAPDQMGDLGELVANITSASSTTEGFVSTLYGTEKAMDAIPNIAKSFSSARLILKKEFAFLRAELNTTLTSFRELKDIIKIN